MKNESMNISKKDDFVILKGSFSTAHREAMIATIPLGIFAWVMFEFVRMLFEDRLAMALTASFLIVVMFRIVHLARRKSSIPIMISNRIVQFGGRVLSWEQVDRFYPYPANSFSKIRRYSLGVHPRTGIHVSDRIPLDDALTKEEFNRVAEDVRIRVLPHHPHLKVDSVK